MTVYGALVTDFYELTMLQAYLEQGMRGTAVFEFFVRDLPARRNFLMAAGLEQVVEYLKTVGFTNEERAWLASTGRFTPDYWTRNCGADSTLDVTIRCVDEADYDGIYQALEGDIPVVKVSAALNYRSILGTLGLGAANLCLRAESETPVVGS